MLFLEGETTVPSYFLFDRSQSCLIFLFSWSFPHCFPKFSSSSFFPFLLFLKNHLFIWLCRVLVTGCRIFDLHCGMRNLSCSTWDLVSWPGIKPGLPALELWNLSHWTTREVPPSLLLMIIDGLLNARNSPSYRAAYDQGCRDEDEKNTVLPLSELSGEWVENTL